MVPRRFGFAPVLAAMGLVFGAAACRPAAAPTATGGPTELTVTATEFKLEPATITVTAGQPVRLTFVNQGLIEHDWEVPGLKATEVRILSAPAELPKRITDEMAAKAARGIPYPMAGAGQRVVLEFTPVVAGTYEMVCEVPGHKEAGMVGKFVVTGDGAAPVAAPTAAAQGGASQQLAGAPRLPVPKVAAPVRRAAAALVPIEIETKETVATLDEGVSYDFWTFNGSVPGPMLRVRQGDTVELTFKNAAESKVTHSIDLHAVTGPGGGARATQVAPGGQATFSFKALNPGVYVYHCATPMVAHHIASGMYGLIVVEPPGGLPSVDREFYVMQGDFYLQGARGEKGERGFSLEKMLDERPDYVLFNGSAGALTGERALKAKVGETVRIFFGVGGPNLTSSFHVIGEIFDRVQPEGASEAFTNVQTTLVPAGGATMVEFTVEVPGTYILVDHSLGRLEKGGAGLLEVEGAEAPEIFRSVAGAAAGVSQGH